MLLVMLLLLATTPIDVARHIVVAAEAVGRAAQYMCHIVVAAIAVARHIVD